MTCEVETMPGGGTRILCSRGPSTRRICDVCDGGATHPFEWQDAAHPMEAAREIDICVPCGVRYANEPEFQQWADTVIRRNLGIAA